MPATVDRDRGGNTAKYLLGLEHELCLWRNGHQVDFRRLIDHLVGSIRPLDPGDPRARRLPSGVAITADGYEAELATPPLPITPDTAHTIDRLLKEERTELRERASSHDVDTITGFSTHLNCSVPDDRVVALGRRFTATCLPAVAAITEPDDSQGVFVRPRRGRLELGCEYVEGPRLVAALTLYAACLSGLSHLSEPAPGPEPDVEPSREKFGWFVSRDQLDGSALTRVWEWARPWAIDLGLDPRAVEQVLEAGSHPYTVSTCSFGRSGLVRSTMDTGARRLTGGLTAETEWLTWHHVVWVFRHRSGRTCRAVVPTQLEPTFLAALDAGELELELARMLRRPLARRQLLVSAQLGAGVELFHEVRPGALVPAERGPDGSLPRVSRRASRRHLRNTLRRSG